MSLTVSAKQSSFGATGGLLAGAASRLTALVKSGSSGVMWYLTAFVVLVFVIMYYLMR